MLPTSHSFTNLDKNVNPTLVKSLLNELQLKYRFEQLKINQMKKELNIKNKNLFEKITAKHYFDEDMIEVKKLLTAHPEFYKESQSFVETNVNLINDSLQKRINYSREKNRTSKGNDENQYFLSDKKEKEPLNTSPNLYSGSVPNSCSNLHGNMNTTSVSIRTEKDNSDNFFTDNQPTPFDPVYKNRSEEFKKKYDLIKSRIQYPKIAKPKSKQKKETPPKIKKEFNKSTTMHINDINNVEKKAAYKNSSRVKNKQQLIKVIDDENRKGSLVRYKANVKLLNQENEYYKKRDKIFDPLSKYDGDILKNNDILVVTLGNEKHLVKKSLIPLEKLKNRKGKTIASQDKIVLKRTNSGKIRMTDLVKNDEMQNFIKSTDNAGLNFNKKGSVVFYEIKPKNFNQGFSKTKSLIPRNKEHIEASLNTKSTAEDEFLGGGKRAKLLNSEKVKLINRAIDEELEKIQDLNYKIDISMLKAEKQYLKRGNPFNTYMKGGGKKFVYIDNSENNILGIGIDE